MRVVRLRKQRFDLNETISAVSSGKPTPRARESPVIAHISYAKSGRSCSRRCIAPSSCRRVRSLRLTKTAGFALCVVCSPLGRIVSSRFPLPGKRVSNDSGEIIVLWCPPQHRAGAIGSRHDLSRIARSARCDLDVEIDTGDALDHLNHLTHRETMAIAAIKRH